MSKLSTNGYFGDAMSASRAASGSASIPCDAGVALTGSAPPAGPPAAAPDAAAAMSTKIRMAAVRAASRSVLFCIVYLD
jgi:hypothetical protein